MEKPIGLRQFLNKNRVDVIAIFAILLLFFTLFKIFYGYLGDFLFDCGREAYFPLEVLKGKVLYKDIFDNYGPFSYQFNAVLYYLMGVSLNTLRMAGATTSIVILTCVYFISRMFTGKFVSYMVVFFTMAGCAFKTFSLFNFIFPYSYAMLYSLCAFLLSVLALLFYLKTARQFLLPLSWFFVGISITSKPEYILYAAFFALITFLVKLEKKYLIYSALSFLIVPAVCFGTLFLQGLTIQDLNNAGELIKRLSTSAVIHDYYESYVGFYPNKVLLKETLFDLGSFLSSFVPLSLSIYFLLFAMKNKWQKWKVCTLGVILMISSYFFIDIFLSTSNRIFSFFPLFSALILMVLIFNYVKLKLYQKSITNCLRRKEGLYFVVVASALLGSLKGLFHLNLNIYGSYFMPLLAIVVVTWAVEFLPKKIKIIDVDAKLWSGTISVVLLITSILYVLFNFWLVKYAQSQILTLNGNKIYATGYSAKSNISAINYIMEKTKPSDTILVLPEGLMFNFLTGRASNDIYFSALMPPNIATFGEYNIIQSLIKDAPDYIFVHNYKIFVCNDAIACENSGLKVCNWIYKNYSKEEVFDNKSSDFKIMAYKKKSK